MKKLLLLISCIVFLMSGSAYSTQIQWTAGNSHLYEVISLPNSTSITWEKAKIAAESGGGYLATITSADENDFVWSLVSGKKDPSFTDYWLGGYQENPGEDEPAGGWSWVTGEDWSYDNWYPGEPNNWIEEQHYLHYWPRDGYWDDMHNADSMRGYIVEYDSAPLPEPATLILFGTGLVGLAGFSRKKFRTK